MFFSNFFFLICITNYAFSFPQQFLKADLKLLAVLKKLTPKKFTKKGNCILTVYETIFQPIQNVFSSYNFYFLLKLTIFHISNLISSDATKCDKLSTK